MNVVVPIAGRGSRFSVHGFTTPKLLIQVAGKPMLAWGLKSIEKIIPTNLIFVALREHEYSYDITHILSTLTNGTAKTILLDDVTDGQVCTVLAARSLINDDRDLLIISPDTYVLSQIDEDIKKRPQNCAGIISVANLPGDRWSFAKADRFGNVIDVAEKSRISDNAGTGLYYFSKGWQFVEYAERMISAQDKTRGEYYVMPLYKRFISAGLQVILSQAEQVWDMGNPQALTEFESHLKME